MARLSHFTFFRGEVYSLEEPDSPEAAICMSAFVASRSSDIYNMLVRKENAVEGMSENSDSRSGAYPRISALRTIVNLLFGPCLYLVENTSIVRRDSMCM